MADYEANDYPLGTIRYQMNHSQLFRKRPTAKDSIQVRPHVLVRKSNRHRHPDHRDDEHLQVWVAVDSFDSSGCSPLPVAGETPEEAVRAWCDSEKARAKEITAMAEQVERVYFGDLEIPLDADDGGG